MLARDGCAHAKAAASASHAGRPYQPGKTGPCVTVDVSGTTWRCCAVANEARVTNLPASGRAHSDEGCRVSEPGDREARDVGRLLAASGKGRVGCCPRACCVVTKRGGRRWVRRHRWPLGCNRGLERLPCRLWNAKTWDRQLQRPQHAFPEVLCDSVVGRVLRGAMPDLTPCCGTQTTWRDAILH